jgi:ABC-2 type transport system ATP-binding protein
MTKIIEAEGLTKVFPPATTAVDGVSFSVDEGEVFGFLGPNGAGKTTTMRILSTLCSVSAGSATVAGYDVARSPGAVRQNIGVVPQEVTLDNELKGVENLMLAAKLQHVRKREATERARELLKLVELDGAADRRVVTYSGGMKRRLQLTTALIHRPRVLFLDEPTSGLDIQTRTKIWEYLKQLNREGLTIFMTTHYLEEADQVSQRVAIMDLGAIKVSGSPSELKDRLCGDVLTLEFSDGVADMTRFLENIENVTEVTRNGYAYRLKLPKVEVSMPGILSAVAASGLKIKQMSLTRPTMDQVFLEVTGRSMRDAEEPQGNGGTYGDTYAKSKSGGNGR